MYDIAFIGNGFETGFNTVVIKPENLTKLKGQIGDFELSCKNNGVSSCVNAKTIVINMEPEQIASVDGAVSFCVDISMTAVPADDVVIFVQDYKCVTPAYLNEIGISKALRIKKDFGKEVIYFYRSLRFTDGDSSLFKNARQAGIVFEKYTGNDMKIENNDYMYTVKIENADYSFSVTSGSLYAAPVIKAEDSFTDIAKILNVICSKDGFFQYDNVYLQPTKTNKRGIYALGYSRGQNGMSDFIDDLDFTISEIDSELSSLKPLTANERKVDSDACALCYTCYRSCPHGAIERDYDKDCMKVNKLACFGCDTCLTVCPAKAISIDDSVSEKPAKNDFKILMCENSAKIAYEQTGISLDDKAGIRYIPCSNSIRKEDIYKELSDIDSKVLVLGCINDACRHIDSNKRFELVVNEAKRQLNELGLDPDRIRFERVSLRMKDKLMEILDGFLGGMDK